MLQTNDIDILNAISLYISRRKNNKIDTYLEIGVTRKSIPKQF